MIWTGVDPDNEVLFFDKYDVPGGGFNFTSYYNPDYQPLELEAKTVEGCSYEDRGAIYKQIQEIFYEDQPYIWLYATRAITGGATSVSSSAAASSPTPPSGTVSGRSRSTPCSCAGSPTARSSRSSRPASTA